MAVCADRGVAVPLVRFDSHMLRVWALEDSRPFSGEDIKERLPAVTDGWSDQQAVSGSLDVA